MCTVTYTYVFPNNRVLRSEDLHHSRGVAPSELAPFAEDSLLLPPVGVWTNLSSSVADHPLRTDIHRCLSKPLPLPTS